VSVETRSSVDGHSSGRGDAFFMANFVKVAKRSDLKEDTGHTVEVKGRLVALFLDKETVYAMDDMCPHMGASLGAGHVCNGLVVCPWHGWRFRINDGRWADAPSSGTAVVHYDAKIEGDDVFLDVNW
jgi:nitrite reductase (NADH) small subunit/3-phenylpropionate/trans-cinnamate dioxygenase ferredoxin subunit